MPHTIPSTVLRRHRKTQFASDKGLGTDNPGVSILHRPDHKHPFAPFRDDDLNRVARLFNHGFDPFWLDERGFTCVMEAATRGHAESLHYALTHSANSRALASLKSDAGLDAFDMAAATGAVACMSTLSLFLDPDYRSSIDRGFMWHAVEGSRSSPTIADAWLASMCLDARMSSWRDAEDAMVHAFELEWELGFSRLHMYFERTGRPLPDLQT